MFLVERLIGVGTYCFVLVMVCILLGFSTVSVRKLLGGYTVTLCVMAFCYEPYTTADLYRIYEMVREFSALDLASFFDVYVRKTTVPFARILYWLIGKTGIPRLLPAVTCLICYGCIFYMLCRTAERSGAGRGTLAAAVFFLMSTGSYMVLISNIRTMLALALIAFCFYRETVERKFSLLHGLLYLVAAGTHNLGVVLLVLRLLCPLADRRLTAGRRAAYFLCLCGGITCAAVMLRPALEALSDKFCAYVLGKQYSYFWEYVIAGIVLLSELCILRQFGRGKEDRYGEYAGLGRLLKLCLLIAVAFCFEFSMFHRLVTYIAPMLAVPLMMLVPGRQREKQPAGPGTQTAVMALSVCALILSCMRGSLCSLKFFVLG